MLQLKLEVLSLKIIRWVGTPISALIHTFLFTLTLLIGLIFPIPFNTVLLILTTWVSLEAIYLSIFIQMSVNIQSTKIDAVHVGINEVQEDIEGVQEDIGEVQEDIEEVQEDIEELEKKRG
jgi:hypothetical protein